MEPTTAWVWRPVIELLSTAVSKEPAANFLKWYGHLSSPEMDAAGSTDISYLHIKYHDIIKLVQS